MPLTKDHPATADFPDQWTYSEEVYFYLSDPREMGATVLVTVDKTKLNSTSPFAAAFRSARPARAPLTSQTLTRTLTSLRRMVPPTLSVRFPSEATDSAAAVDIQHGLLRSPSTVTPFRVPQSTAARSTPRSATPMRVS